MNIGYIDRRANIAVKVEQAEKHITELKDAVESFLKSNPYSIFDEEDPQTGQYVYKLQIHKHPPPEWSAIIGDTIHNLRAALDVLVWQLILANRGQPTRNNAFPISGSAEGFRDILQSKVKGVALPALKLFEAAEPYKGGKGEKLWILNQLDIRDKHRLLIPVFTQLGGVAINPMFADMMRKAEVASDFKEASIQLWRQMGSTLVKPAYSGPVKDGDILHHTLTKPDSDPQFVLDIAFGEGEIVQGKPILPTLIDFLGLVKRVLEPFGQLLVSQ